MSYKYDRENGDRDTDTIGADKEDFNPEVNGIVDTLKKLSSDNVREAINAVGCKEKQRQIDEQSKNQDTGDITMTRNPNLVEDIQKDIESGVSEERAIKITSQNKEDDGREAM